RASDCEMDRNAVRLAVAAWVLQDGESVREARVTVGVRWVEGVGDGAWVSVSRERVTVAVIDGVRDAEGADPETVPDTLGERLPNIRVSHNATWSASMRGMQPRPPTPATAVSAVAGNSSLYGHALQTHLPRTLSYVTLVRSKCAVAPPKTPQ